MIGQTTDLPLDQLLGPLGLLAFLLVAVVWGGRKRWWVFGWVYDAKAAEAAEWKALALSSTAASEAGVRTIEKVVGNGGTETPR